MNDVIKSKRPRDIFNELKWKEGPVEILSKPL
ncbi:hypothetical protein SAMN04488587_1418 [Methanococcoides vulcani]|uniref:Uncharacterized protein n=1 Tax=Methanococcoides vulcani TaxID=1353158 RepID=A0A1I0A103_9EURY|nr:hypothetical protein SAMN04488587_1418 [Methanococcoides vulcani]